MDQNNELKIPQVAILMVPFPAQGHLNQLLHLSRLLSSAYNLSIHYVGTTTHIHQAKLRLHGWDASDIHFHELETPSYLSPPPDPTTSIAFPAHLQPLFEASTFLREPVHSLLCQLSVDYLRVVVIHDSMTAYVVQDVATIPNAESYTFHSVSAFCIYWFTSEFFGLPIPVDEIELAKEIPSTEGCFTPEFMEFIGVQMQHEHFNSGNIYNACKSIEGKYVDLINEYDVSTNTNSWAIGPFNPLEINPSKSSDDRHSCLNWLDKQNPNSVVFVSFGTTTSFTDEQINEIALGLETSDKNFIWVLRDADKGDVFDENVRRAKLPKGFEERGEGKGIVVRDWAPQLEILAHSATGGFLSHCGWNSCMESITCGVPIATWPMHSDQPRNAVLVTKVLKVGVTVKDWARRSELVTASMVETGVRRLMEGKEGDDMRERAGALAMAAKRAVAAGGVSKMELNSFVAHITR